MDGHVKVGGVWKRLQGLHVKTSGVWKEVLSAYVKVGGVWKQFYTNAVITLAGAAGLDVTDVFPGTYTTGIRVNTDGTIDHNNDGSYSQINSGTDWIIPNGAASSAAEIRVTNNGAALNGSSDSTGVWLDMSVAREWGVSRSAAGISTFDIDVEMRFNSGAPTVGPGNYSGEVEVVVIP